MYIVTKLYWPCKQHITVLLNTNFLILFGTHLGKFFRVNIRLTNGSVLRLISFEYLNYVSYNGYSVNMKNNKRP